MQGLEHSGLLSLVNRIHMYCYKFYGDAANVYTFCAQGLLEILFHTLDPGGPHQNHFRMEHPQNKTS